MQYPEDSETKDKNDTIERQRLLLDGTANLDYQDEEQIPRVKGLIELLNEYLGQNQEKR